MLRTARLAALALAFWAPRATLSATGADAAPGDLIRAAQATRPGSAAPLPRHPAAAIRLLAESAALPSGDLTPLLVQALAEPDLLDAASREALEILLSAPALAGERMAARDGLRVHYPAAGTHDPPVARDVTPAWVLTALEGLVAARAEGKRLGLRPPAGSDAAGFDLYLVRLGGRAAGYAAPRPGDQGDGWPAFAVLDPVAFTDPSLLRAFAARLYGRAIGFAYRPLAPAWWAEPAAFWFEDRAAGTGALYDGHVAERRFHPERGATPRELGRALGNLDLVRTLDAAGDGLRVRRVWELAAVRPEAPMMEALDLAVRGERPSGSGVDRLLADLAVRSVVEDERGDGPPVGIAARHDAYPVAAIDAVTPVEPLGSSVVVLVADDDDGGLRLRVEGAGRWGADLLLARRDGTGFVRTAVDVDAAGGGEIGVPWADYERAFLLVRNLESEGPPASYSYTATPEARYPFSIRSVEVLAEDGGRLLAWETGGEQDMFGWLVYRAATSVGPWERLTRFPLPALGAVGEPAAYEILDDDPIPDGQGAYYRVVGVTEDGLTRAVDAGGIDR